MRRRTLTYEWRDVARIWAFGKRILLDEVGIGTQQTSDESGVVWFRRLPPGPYLVRLVGGEAERRITVREGRDETVVWDL